MSFTWQQAELPGAARPLTDELLNVEFRSPRATTYLIRAFWVGGSGARVRFTPTEPGTWTYHTTSPIKRFNDQEGTFSVADSGNPGLVGVANLRHWWTTNKQPHLWFGVVAPMLAMDQGAFETWLEARKHDGFTHVRATLLSNNETLKPLTADGQPNFAYFDALDDRALAAANRGFALDFILADESFARALPLSNWDRYAELIRYLIFRYGALNGTWQGVEQFEKIPGARTFLQQCGALFEKYDSYRRPRATDARDSSSPLIPDRWMNYLVEASPSPELGAVEHQFTEMPEIHFVTATDPVKFRNELWNCTTNGEYPTIAYESLRNEANLKAAQTWFKIMTDTRHWELEPYFDVDGARSVGLNEVEYLAYAQTPGIVEITLPKHKYNPEWVNPATGEEIPLKDYKGEVLSRQTPDGKSDWILNVPREGHKQSMLRSYRFESQDPPVQEIEIDSSKIPFQIEDPQGDSFPASIPAPFKLKMTKSNRSTRSMQYVWWGEVVDGSEGPRLLGVGPSGTFRLPTELIPQSGANLHVRLQGINANGKAFQIDRVYRLTL